MSSNHPEDRSRQWLPWSGIAAAVGTVLWTVTPWVQTAVLGTRPYVATIFDVSSFGGWMLMLVGLVGFRATFNHQYGRLGRGAVGTTAIGMTLVAGLLFRRVIRFIRAGFQAVPATGEDPAGLLLTFATLLGLGLTVAGAGGIGLALRRFATPHVATSWLLLLAPMVPLVLIGLRLLSVLPVPLGWFVVNTNAALIPFGFGWVALGVVIWSYA